MTRQPSTIRTSSQPTIEDPLGPACDREAADSIIRYWQDEAGASVLRTCEAFPSLALNRSLLLDLAVEEFKAKGGESGFSTRTYCEQFRQFGSHFEQSVCRAIEVQKYLKQHPELLGVVSDFSWPSPGEEFQGFEVVEELGRGALARAYLCRESGLAEREVVVKIARADGYEAELLARLDHPNIVPIYSVSSDSQRYVTCICMPFRGRSTLQDLVDQIEDEVPQDGTLIRTVARDSDPDGIRQAPKGDRSTGNRNYIDSIIRLASTLANALAYAHSLGVLHGDLKPSNVLLTGNGEPLLIDFNLAKDQSKEAVPRGGTLAYMPPELICSITGESRGICGNYDARSEVYSFGALLFQLLTGQVPYPLNRNESDAVSIAHDLLQQQHRSRPQARTLNRAVNHGLEQLVLRCLAASPTDRPQSMAEVASQLRKQATLLPRVSRYLRLRPIRSIAIVVTAAVILICFAIYALTLPPHHVRQFERGVAYQKQGDYSAAATCFRRAMEDDSIRPEAVYQRARSYLLNDEPSLAMAEFRRSEVDYGDNRGTAEIGYCFNLRGDHDAAIVCYEKALSAGFESAELQNNLGISYALCKSHVGHLERFERAVAHLNRAIALNDRLFPARINLMTVTLLRGEHLDPTDAKLAAENVEWLLKRKSGDRIVLRMTPLVYGRISSADRNFTQRCAEVCRLALEAGVGPTRNELENSFAHLRGHKYFSGLYEHANESPPVLKRRTERFIDPVSDSNSSAASDLQHSL